MLLSDMLGIDMRFQIPLSGKNIHTLMRQAGYAPGFSQSSEEPAFQRPGGNTYPKFHVYAKTENGSARLNLHLDQKRPSYGGTHAHAAEHDGPVVEAEAARIKEVSAP